MDQKIEQWAKSHFEGLSHAELREAGKVLACDFAPNTPDATMRAKLNEIMGAGVPQEVVQAPTARVINLPRLSRPKLLATDVWEGRRHRVRVNKTEEDAERICFVLTWDGVPRSFEFGVDVDMPEPYYNVLRMAENRIVRQRKIKDGEDHHVRNESYVVRTPKFSFQYFGVTHGTEDLPGGVLEYWQKRAERNDYFSKLPGKPGGRQALIQILSDLSEPKGPEYYKDLTDQDILVQIIRLLGFEHVLYGNIEEVLVS